MLSKEKHNSKKKYFIPDSPITSSDQDIFGYEDFVYAIKYALEHITPPLNIALYGSWGTGKSSILSLLKEKLVKDSEFGGKFQYVYVDAWKLSPESLRQELLEELNKQFGGVFKQNIIEDRLWNVREEYTQQKLSKGKQLINALISFIPYGVTFATIIGVGSLVGYYTNLDLRTPTYFSSVVIPMLSALVMRFKSVSDEVVRTSKRIIPRIESSSQFEAIFNDIVNKKKTDKVIIAIDNLDRCEDDAVVKILGTLKTFMNHDKCIYIIPCDEQAIIKHIVAVRGGGKTEERDAIDFLNKFFQITIHIPPFIEGHLEQYVEEQISEFDIDFDTNTKDVLILGLTKNPRKIRQYLYDLVVLYKLAEAKETRIEHPLPKGTLTANTGLLAKIIVLRTEWPDFYRRLLEKEDLIDLLEGRFFGEPTGESPNEGIEEILQQNTGLEWFLRNTQVIPTTNISAVLTLNQEEYESTIIDLNAFVLKISQGEVESIHNQLSKISEKERENYIQEALKKLDVYMQNSRTQFAFNLMNVLLEIYDIIPNSLKNEVLSKLSIHLNNQQIKLQMHRLNAEKLFNVILKMTNPNKDILLKQIATDFVRVIASIDPFLPQFIAHKDELSQNVIRDFNFSIRDVISSSPEFGFKAIQTIVKDPKAIQILVKPDICQSIIQRINNNSGQDSKNIVDYYMLLRRIDSEDNKVQFINRLLSIANANNPSAIDANIQFTLDALSKFDNNELTAKPSEILIDGMGKIATKLANENDKIKVLLPTIKQAGNLEDSKKIEFVSNTLPKIISSMSPNGVVQFLIQLINSNVYDLYSDSLMSNIISKLNQIPPNLEAIQFLLKFTPEAKTDGFINFVKGQLANNPALTLSVVAQALKSNQDLRPEFIRKISHELLATATSRPMQEVTTMLNHLSVISNKLGYETCDEIANLLIIWINHPEAAIFQNGQAFMEKFYFNLSKDKQDKIFELVSKFARNSKTNVNYRGFTNMLISNYEKFEPDKKNKIDDLLLSIFIGTTKSEEYEKAKITEFIIPDQIGKGNSYTVRSAIQGRTTEGFLDLAVVNPDWNVGWFPDKKSYDEKQDTGILNLDEKTYSNSWSFDVAKNAKSGKYIAIMGLYEKNQANRRRVAYSIKIFEVV